MSPCSDFELFLYNLIARLVPVELLHLSLEGSVTDSGIVYRHFPLPQHLSPCSKPIGVGVPRMDATYVCLNTQAVLGRRAVLVHAGGIKQVCLDLYM